MLQIQGTLPVLIGISPVTVILHLQEHTEAKKIKPIREDKEAEDKINKVQAELDS